MLRALFCVPEPAQPSFRRSTPYPSSAGWAKITLRGARGLMNTPPIVSAEEWEAARQKLLVKEKELTHARDAMAAARRRMPWLAVTKHYEFDGPNGRASLLDLFEGRRQLIV